MTMAWHSQRLENPRDNSISFKGSKDAASQAEVDKLVTKQIQAWTLEMIYERKYVSEQRWIESPETKTSMGLCQSQRVTTMKMHKAETSTKLDLFVCLVDTSLH